MTRTFTLSACTLGIAVCLLVVNTAMAVANQQSVTLASNLPSLSFQDQPDANKKGRPGDSTENREVVIQRLHREFEHAAVLRIKTRVGTPATFRKGSSVTSTS